ncbi:MAG: trimethylamine methyltransferase, partial [Alphaproteobacteria bacterium]
MQARTTPSEQPNPCPPGQIGGQYKPLTEQALTQIIDTAFHLLEHMGMGDVPGRFQDLALAKG